MEDRSFVFNLAPTGMVPTKQHNPDVPTSATEIARDVARCAAFGITSVHLHARDAAGQPTSDPAIYTDIIAAVRETTPDMVLIVSCSGRNNPDYASRAPVLQLQGDVKPDMASLTLSSLNFPQGASINEPDTIIRLAETMQANNIKPELEIFDLGMMHYAHFMIRKGYLQPPFYFNFMLGNITSAQADLSHLGLLLRELPDNALWTVGGIGRAQWPAAMMAMSQGGGVRIGLEDNLWLDADKQLPASNIALVEKTAQLATLAGMTPMTPAALRARLS